MIALRFEAPGPGGQVGVGCILKVCPPTHFGMVVKSRYQGNMYVKMVPRNVGELEEN